MSSSKLKSWAPYGDTLPRAKARLECAEDESDPEHIMMQLWEDEHTPRDFLLYMTPLHAILLSEESNELSEHDRKIVSATVQWFATNCGRAFHEKFRVECKRRRAEMPKKTCFK